MPSLGISVMDEHCALCGGRARNSFEVAGKRYPYCLETCRKKLERLLTPQRVNLVQKA